jgi:hypothetical protein
LLYYFAASAGYLRFFSKIATNERTNGRRPKGLKANKYKACFIILQRIQYIFDFIEASAGFP